MNTDSRPELAMSTSAGTIRGLHMPLTAVAVAVADTSRPHSPQPSAPPSPTDSISSFPSVSSSFFFSSGAASPPPSHPDTDPEDVHGPHGSESTSGLIIPHLALPSALRRPTIYGQVLGEIRVLVLGRHGVKKSRVVEMLLEGNEDLVDVDEADDEEDGQGRVRTKVWRASTDWVEHGDAHGLEKIEPSRNVEVVMWPGYDAHTGDPTSITRPILDYIHTSFHALHAVIDPASSSALLANLVSAPSTPLWTLAVLVGDKDGTLTSMDRSVLAVLSAHIPLIVLPAPPPPSAYPIQAPSFHETHVSHSPSPSHSYPRNRADTVSLARVSSDRPHSRSRLSAFRPAHVFALRAGLFRSPETLALLRAEAGERWVRWRRGRGRREGWSKRRWEEELAREHERGRGCGEAMGVGVGMDPLHLPSLWAVAVGLFTGGRGAEEGSGSGSGWGWIVLAAAAFCAGVGVGWGLVNRRM